MTTMNTRRVVVDKYVECMYYILLIKLLVFYRTVVCVFNICSKYVVVHYAVSIQKRHGRDWGTTTCVAGTTRAAR